MTTTKLELIQRLDAAMKDNEQLRLEIAQLKGTLEARAHKAVRGNVKTLPTPAVHPDMLAYRQYREARKARAHAEGAAVRVLSFIEFLTARDAKRAAAEQSAPAETA